MSTDTRQEDQQIAGRNSNCGRKGSSCLEDEQMLPALLKGSQSEMNEAQGRKRIKTVAWCFKQQFLHISLKRSNKEKHTPCTQRQGDPALALQLNFGNKKHGDRHDTKALHQFLSHCLKDCGTKDQLLFGQSCQQCVDLCPKSIRSNVGRTALIFTCERNFEERM